MEQNNLLFHKVVFLQKNTLWLFFYSAILFVSSCEFTISTPIPKDNFSINLTLRSDLDTQSLSLKKLKGFNDQNFEAIANAIVKITDDYGNTWQGLYKEDNYIFEELRPILGETYNLEILIENNTLVKGSTTIPDKKIFSTSGLIFSWVNNNNLSTKLSIKGVDTTVNIFKEVKLNTFYNWKGATTTNSIRIPKSFLYFSGNQNSSETIEHTFASEKYYSIKLETYDTNLTIFSTEASARQGFDLGYGVFGSICVLDTTIKLFE